MKSISSFIVIKLVYPYVFHNNNERGSYCVIKGIVQRILMLLLLDLYDSRKIKKTTSSIKNEKVVIISRFEDINNNNKIH